MKRVAFLGTNGGVSFAAMGFDRALAAIGQNTGNAMFQFALWQRVRNPRVAVNISDAPAAVRELADILVIPAANQVNPAWDLSPWADFIEQVDLPLVVIGLGAQADIREPAKLPLKEGTERFMRVASERCTKIGVRGVFTQEVLAAHGITNTVVTGCPSQHINPAISGAEIAARLARVATMAKPKIGYVFGTMEEHTRKAEASLFKLAASFGAPIIYQTNRHVLRLIFSGDMDDEARTYLAWEAGVLHKGRANAEAHISDIRKRGVFYSDARSWIDSMRSFDMVFGLRIHGAVAAIQSGGLGLCVAFDSRTLELAQTMDYPYVKASALGSEVTLPDLVAATVFDAPSFDASKERFKRTIDSLLVDRECVLAEAT